MFSRFGKDRRVTGDGVNRQRLLGFRWPTVPTCAYKSCGVHCKRDHSIVSDGKQQKGFNTPGKQV